MGIEDYPTQKIQNATQLELMEMRKAFEKEEISYSNLLVFFGYNALALYSMNLYVRHFVNSRRKPKTDKPLQMSKIKRKYGFDKVLKKGSLYGLLMGGLYIGGLIAVGYQTLPLSAFKKYFQIQAAEQSFGIVYNPEFQEMMLIDKMKAFGFSQTLLDDIRLELDQKKRKLIENGQFNKETLRIIEEGEEKWKSKMGLVN